MTNRMIGLGLLVLLVGSACGNGPKYKVDEAVIADLPMSARGELLARQADRDRARSEVQKARADVITSEHAIVTAQAEREQAKQGTRKVENALDLAKPRRDVALLSQLQINLNIAKLAESAAEVRLAWCQQQREVSEAKVDAALTYLDLTEARIEQARAHLAVNRGRLPSGNAQVGTFDEQAMRAERRNDKQQQDVMSATNRSAALEREYADRLSAYSEQRSQSPSFTASYTPPGYTPPQPRAQAGYVPGS